MAEEIKRVNEATTLDDLLGCESKAPELSKVEE